MRDKHSTTKILLTISAIIIVLIGSATVVVGWHTHTSMQAHATVMTDSTNGKITTISYAGQNGKSALSLLKLHATVTTKDSSNGEPFVESIDGVAGGNDGKYWIFYVNGQETSVGASTYITHNTETITWKLQ